MDMLYTILTLCFMLIVGVGLSILLPLMYPAHPVIFWAFFALITLLCSVIIHQDIRKEGHLT